VTNHCQPFACSPFESFFSCHSEGAFRSPCHSDPEPFVFCHSEGAKRLKNLAQGKLREGEAHGSGQAPRPKNLLSLESSVILSLAKNLFSLRFPCHCEEPKVTWQSLLSLEGRGLRACPEFIGG